MSKVDYDTEKLDALRDYFGSDETANIEEVYEVIALINKPIFILFYRLATAGFSFLTDIDEDDWLADGPYCDNAVGVMRDLSEVDEMRVRLKLEGVYAGTMALDAWESETFDCMQDYTVPKSPCQRPAVRFNRVVNAWYDDFEQ